ncbi:GNAT family N-acetyltransferase [Moraxella atlantae]|uniref:GNAT family N-acetyltransferase n=1 Tax=Faucicola atlantae TaxID=34059 RepID=UPI003752B44A
MPIACPYTIRHAVPTDLPAIVAIYNQSIASKTATADLAPVTVAARQTWFAEHGMAQCRLLLVAQDDAGQVCGWARLSRVSERAAFDISAEISVYLAIQARGHGLGKQLVHELLALAPTLGVRQVMAWVFAHNTASLALFGQLGFVEWGRLPQVCDMQGFLADVVILGKPMRADKC